MNKKERAAYDAALAEAAQLRALRWSDYPETRDLPPPGQDSPYLAHSQGWDFIDSFRDFRVHEAWSNTVFHGFGRHDDRHRGGASQSPRPLFSTKLRALWALRRALERQYARALAEVDKMIAEEEERDAPK